MKFKSFIPYKASTKSPAHIELAIINLIILNTKTNTIILICRKRNWL